MAVGDYDPTKMKDVIQNGVSQVSSTVQQAVTSGDFSNLSADVGKELEELFGNIGRTVNTSFRGNDNRGVNQGTMGYHSPAQDQNWKNTETYRHIHDINQQRQNAAFANGQVPVQPFPQQQMPRRAQSGRVPAPSPQNPLYADVSSTKLSATLGIVLGFLTFGVLGLAVGGLLLMHGGIATILALLFAVIPIGGLIGGIAGVKTLGTAERFEKYVAFLRNKTHIDVSTLAEMTGSTPEAIVKDLKKMIKNGWFKQGHMEDGDTALITSNETFLQYREATQQAQERAREEEGYTQEQREIFNQGELYIKEIRECNREIRDDVITEKLDRMEHSVSMIVERAKQKPSLTVDLHRLMNYYLPTMVKLLHSYVDLSRQDKTSANIEKSKQEIENTIDLMNNAFDKMFDDLFDDTSLDISTDAEVLKQLLTQEGLTGHSFTSDQTMPFSAPTFPTGPQAPQANNLNQNG